MGHFSITIGIISYSAPIFTWFFTFSLHTALLLFPLSPSLIHVLPPPLSPWKRKKKSVFLFPSCGVAAFSHSWEYILNLASQSISDKHIMFYFKHKMQFWSFHNDTVNRAIAKKHKETNKPDYLFFSFRSQLLICCCFFHLEGWQHADDVSVAYVFLTSFHV